MGKIIKHHKKINNEGSALVTVIVAACLLSIIATTLLFVTVKNYKARQIAYQSKQNFYEAEKTLDELRAIITMDTSKACSSAYISVMNEYLELSNEERQSTYNDLFVDAFFDIWSARSVDGDCAKTIRSVLGDSLGINTELESASTFQFNEAEGYVVFPDIVVSVSSLEGYYTRIRTDIRIDAPGVDWANGDINSNKHTINMDDYVSYVNWRRD